jgi:hypothetical protein
MVWLGLAGTGAWGARALAVEPAPDSAVRTVSIEDYQARLGRVRELVARCAADAKACDAAAVGDDDRVQGNGADFEVHWEWLRGALAQAKKAGATDRTAGLKAVSSRLDEQAREAGMEPAEVRPRAVEFGKTRAAADAVLARGEFRAVTEEAFWQRVMARLAGWLRRVFSGASKLGRYAAWLGPALEWGGVLTMCVGAVLWGLRVLRRQRLAIALEAPAAMREWEEVSRRWAEAARAAAEAGEWREAVHSLYWASVVELEGRKVWRQSRGRTPREYLRLLEAGSPYYGPVRGLTGLLERIWYGLAEAGRGDYEQALALYESVRSA